MSFLALARRWRSPFTASGEGEKEPRLARKNPYYTGPRSDHFDGLRFFIPGGPRDKTASDIAKMLWRSRRERKPWPRLGQFVIGERPPRRVEGGRIRLTFIGHSSFLLQTEGVNLLLDPVWSQRAGPAGLGPRRVTPPGLDLADLPPIDAVIVSHNHYDHCDVATLAKISHDHPAPVLTPLGNDAILQRTDRAIPAQTFDWGGSASVGPLKIHFEPANHWSQRRRGDARMALWASFVIEGPRHKIYFAGDTGYGDGSLFKDIARRHGPMRLALLPIGAYAPRWFMRDHHCDPEEAARIFKHLKAEYAFACHWGTFRLTQEPYDEPVARLKAALHAAGIDEVRFRSDPPGSAVEWA
jgi:L-ascorbate metabolism protein UlaG (beta-lactamase superfamily)